MLIRGIGETILASEWGTKEEREVLTKQLQKLVKDAWSSQKVAGVQKDWESFIEKNRAIIKSLRAIQNIIKTSETGEYDKALLRLVFYLFIVEGGFANYMNFVCSMLISQGHDLFNFFDKDFACCLEKMANVDIYTKELFLEEHSFSLLNKGLDRKLRNAIAHYDFKIEGDGTVKIDGVKTDVNKKLQEILSFVCLTSKSIIPVALECEKQFKLRQAEKV
jgi:DNA primase large subunit